MDSSKIQINLIQRLFIISVQYEGDIEITTKTQTLSNKVLHDGLDEKINSISQYQKAFIKKRLLRLANESRENAEIICDYIIAEQTEINIKESTKEGKIKCLVWLSSFHSDKSFRIMTKQDILNYLNSLRKPESETLHTDGLAPIMLDR